ncbi:MAG: hypothetical protein HYS56_02035 [Candidatus Omnitrophica bacterium]|nr:hypothetical protein [Candidatus Omnitrophota bacterium]
MKPQLILIVSVSCMFFQFSFVWALPLPNEPDNQARIPPANPATPGQNSGIDQDRDGISDILEDSLNNRTLSMQNPQQESFPHLDVNEDSVVDLLDLQAIAAAFRTQDSDYDFDQNGAIDISDLVSAARLYEAKVVKNTVDGTDVLYYLNPTDQRIYQFNRQKGLGQVGQFVHHALSSGAEVFVVSLDNKTQFWGMTDRNGKFLLSSFLTTRKDNMEMISRFATILDIVLHGPSNGESFNEESLLRQVEEQSLYTGEAGSYQLVNLDPDLFVSFLAALIRNKDLFHFSDQEMTRLIASFRPSEVKNGLRLSDDGQFDSPSSGTFLIETLSNVLLQNPAISPQRMKYFVFALARTWKSGHTFNLEDKTRIKSVVEQWIKTTEYDISNPSDQDALKSILDFLYVSLSIGRSPDDLVERELKDLLADFAFQLTLDVMALNEPKSWLQNSFDTQMAARFAMVADKGDSRVEVLLRQNMGLNAGTPSPILEQKLSLWNDFGILFWEGDSSWSMEELVLADRALSIVTPEVIERTSQLGLIVMNTLGGTAGAWFIITWNHLFLTLPHRLDILIHEVMHKQFYSLPSTEQDYFENLHNTHAELANFISYYAKRSVDEDAADTGAFLLSDLISSLGLGIQAWKEGSIVLEKDLLILRSLIQSSVNPDGTYEQFMSVGVSDQLGQVRLLKAKVATDGDGNITSISLDVPLGFDKENGFQITYNIQWKEKRITAVDAQDNFQSLWEKDALGLLNFAATTNHPWFLDRIAGKIVEGSFIQNGNRYMRLSSSDRQGNQREFQVPVTLYVIKSGSFIPVNETGGDLLGKYDAIEIDLLQEIGSTYHLWHTRNSEFAHAPVDRRIWSQLDFPALEKTLTDFLKYTRVKDLEQIDHSLKNMELRSYVTDAFSATTRFGIFINGDLKFFDVLLTYNANDQIAKVTLLEKDFIGQTVGTLEVSLQRNDLGEIADLFLKEYGDPIILKQLLNK